LTLTTTFLFLLLVKNLNSHQCIAIVGLGVLILKPRTTFKESLESITKIGGHCPASVMGYVRSVVD